jgi:hypothetical protein
MTLGSMAKTWATLKPAVGAAIMHMAMIMGRMHRRATIRTCSLGICGAKVVCDIYKKNFASVAMKAPVPVFFIF